MTKFNVGDKVRVVSIDQYCMHGFEVGDVCEVFSVDKGGRNRYGIRRRGLSGYANAENLSQHIDTNRRLTEARAKIASLEAEVAALLGAKSMSLTTNIAMNGAAKMFDSKKFAADLTKLLEGKPRPKLTPNQRRADVIKRAQAFVKAQFTQAGGEYVEGSHGHAKVDFYVNAEKRTVVARITNAYCGDWSVRAVAKCAPDDVFNADIGKAIALGRALGVKVPKEFTDAPKPTEVVVGMRVKYCEESVEISENGPWGWSTYGTAMSGSLVARESVIIDDTNAVYL